MRLLRGSSYNFEEFFEPVIPPYAILSHRWEDDEVLFQDIENNEYRSKNGFRKIQFACNQAKRDGLEFVWVDTCSIDKRSSAELSEAINSIYRWYQEAKICYAFLHDVPGSSGSPVSQDSFAASVWFTRGWTLQELIAPRRVVFYGSGWSLLGTRDGMRKQISEITGISIELLADNERPPLSRFSIAQRMSWAALRETARIEDRAYSLLGLFAVNMPLIYGEGQRAFIRLQEEIIKYGTDLSIFAWDFDSFAQDFYSKRLFATSPDDFASCGAVRLSQTASDPTSAEMTLTMTNVGLRIENPLIAYFLESEDNEIALSLGCRGDDVTTVFALQLEPMRRPSAESVGQQGSSEAVGSICYPGWSDVGSEEVSGIQRITTVDLDAPHISPAWRVITIPRNIHSVYHGTIATPSAPTHIWIKLPRDAKGPWQITKVYPSRFWNENNCTFALQDSDIWGVNFMWFHGAVVASRGLYENYVIYFAFRYESASKSSLRIKSMKYRPMMLLNSVGLLTEADENPTTQRKLPSGEVLIISRRDIRRSGIFILVLEMRTRNLGYVSD